MIVGIWPLPATDERDFQSTFHPYFLKMELFPTQYSTLSSTALKGHIAAKYGIAGVSCKFLLHGVSDTYVVATADAKYILKIYRDAHRSLEEIRGEVELLNYLKDAGCKVASPLYDVEGQQLQQFRAAEGTRYGVLFHFAEGKCFTDLSDSQLEIMGREMAYNHNFTSIIQLKNNRREYNTDTTVTQPLRLLEKVFIEFELACEYIMLKQTASRVVAALATLGPSGFSYGYCHYDYFPKNFFFDENYNFTLFDFDFAGKGFLAYDLASFQVSLFFRVLHFGMPVQDAIRSFDLVIASYRQIRPISDHEVESVPLLGYMLLLFYLCFQYENFDDWSNPFFNAGFVKGRVAAMSKYLETFYDADL